MSATIKAAIQALKNRIADAYTAVSNKGGTLPATQDSANLPTAIASIPSGGGGSPYDGLLEMGAPQSVIDDINSRIESDVAYSEAQGAGVKNKPYVVWDGAIGASTFHSCGSIEILVHASGNFTGYISFYGCFSLRYLYLMNGGRFDGSNSCYYTFYQCYALQIIDGVIECIGVTDVRGFLDNAVSLREIRLKWIDSIGLNLSGCTLLSYESLLYLLTNATTPRGGSGTFTLGATNITKLNATEEGRAAIAAAQALGWTIA